MIPVKVQLQTGTKQPLVTALLLPLPGWLLQLPGPIDPCSVWPSEVEDQRLVWDGRARLTLRDVGGGVGGGRCARSTVLPRRRAAVARGSREWVFEAERSLRFPDPGQTDDDDEKRVRARTKYYVAEWRWISHMGIFGECPIISAEEAINT